MNLELKADNIRYVYYVLLLFLFFYGMQITGLVFSTTKYALIFITAEAILLRQLYVRKDVIVQMFLVGLVVFYSYYISLTVGDGDMQIVELGFTLMLECYLIGSLLVNILKYRGFTAERFLNLLTTVLALQGFLMLMMLIVPSFRDFIFGITGNIGKNQFIATGHRGLALSWHKYYDFSSFQSIGAIAIAFKYRYAHKLSRFDIFKYVLIIFSVVTSGRTGLIGVALSFAVFALSFIYVRKRVIRYLVILVFMPLLAYESLSVISPQVYNKLNERLLPWAFEAYYNYLESGEITTESSDYLLDNFYFDVSEQTMLYGDGRYKDGNEYYMDTDAGYMRHILFFGLLGSSILIFSYLRLALISYLRGNSVYSTIVIICIAYNFLVHYKGDVLLNSLINMRLAVVLFLVFTYSSIITLEKDQKLVEI